MSLSIPGGIPDWGLEIGDDVAEGLPMARFTGCSAAEATAAEAFMAYLNLAFALDTGLAERPLLPPVELPDLGGTLLYLLEERGRVDRQSVSVMVIDKGPSVDSLLGMRLHKLCR